MNLIRYLAIIIVQLLILLCYSCASSGIFNLTTYKEKEIENDPSKISTLLVLIDSKEASAGIQELTPDCLCMSKIFIDKEPIGFDGKEPFIGDLQYYVGHPQFINFPTCDSFQQFADPNKLMFYLPPGKHTIYFLFDKWCAQLHGSCNRNIYKRTVTNYHKFKVPIICDKSKKTTIIIDKAFGSSDCGTCDKLTIYRMKDSSYKSDNYKLKPSYKIIKE